MVRVRDNNTKRFNPMYPNAAVPDEKHYFRIDQLRPEEKLKAIQRVVNGETKVSVAKDINVSESTVRGWCRNVKRIQFIADRELLTKKTNKNSSLPQATSVEYTQSTSPTSDIALDASHRPWTANLHNVTSTSTTNHGRSIQIDANNQYYPDPCDLPGRSTHSLSPTPTTSKLDRSVVEKLGYNSAALSLPLDLRLPEGLSIRPNPGVGMVDTSSDNRKCTYNNISITISNNINDRNNNTTVERMENCDNKIDPFEAYRCAQIFYNWFQTYSDPTITSQDFLKFEDLFRRVGDITQRLQNSPQSDKSKKVSSHLEIGMDKSE
ncbi:uncharacterized protein LOC119082555 isoform X2 [Bradysia coprophila]|uniref:uncharacterized protein LOC119082555 isoform X2 n=1 Tax=Bradysia coprophila TaxID=38358 RepID=UPI00187DD5C1|nr:uncharacterized protein LOC119082555 isoform X2 [Bradysia coprophila]